jgi:hypothetical protein
LAKRFGISRICSDPPVQQKQNRLVSEKLIFSGHFKVFHYPQWFANSLQHRADEKWCSLWDRLESHAFTGVLAL